MARRTDRSSAFLLVSSARQWRTRRLLGQIAYQLTSSFLPLVSGSPNGSSDGSLIGLLTHFFRSSVARQTDRSSTYFLVPSTRQWLARRIARRLTSSFLPLVSGSPDGSLVGLLPLPSAHQWLARLAERSAHRLTSSFLPLVSGLPGSPDGSLIDLLPRSFCSSVACPARRMDHSSTYFLVPSARQWLDRRFLGRIARRLTSSFLPLVSRSPDGSLVGLLPRSFRSSVACPARRTERSSAYLLVPSAHQWLARLAGRSARRLTCSFLPLISGLPGSPDGSLIGLLARFFRSSVACPARRTDRSSTYFLVPSARQWLARLAGRSAHRLTSSFLPLVSGSPDGSSDGSLIGLLPRFFRSSVARRTDRSSAYFLVPSARQWLAGRIARRLTSSFLPLVSGSPDGLVIGLLPPSFRSSVACLARRTERSSAYFLVPSARQWLARLARRIAHRLTSSFLPPISGLPGSPDGALIGLLPRSFRSSVACPTACRTDRSSAYFLVPSARQSLAGRIARRLTSSFLPLINGLHDGLPDGSLFGLLPRSFRSSVA